MILSFETMIGMVKSTVVTWCIKETPIQHTPCSRKSNHNGRSWWKPKNTKQHVHHWCGNWRLRNGKITACTGKILYMQICCCVCYEKRRKREKERKWVREREGGEGGRKRDKRVRGKEAREGGRERGGREREGGGREGGKKGPQISCM